MLFADSSRTAIHGSSETPQQHAKENMEQRDQADSQTWPVRLEEQPLDVEGNDLQIHTQVGRFLSAYSIGMEPLQCVHSHSR